MLITTATATTPAPARARRLARFGLAWALCYLPIHVYWALGGLSRPIGIDGSQAGFGIANWGACLVIAGAGLTCLSLVQPWGELLPRAVRSGAAWVGGGFACLHWTLFTATSALRLAGAVGYPRHGDPTAAQLRRFDWWNLAYFELWFAVMGVVLIGCAVLTRPAARAAAAPGRPGQPGQPGQPRRLGTAVTLAGVATVVWGVYTLDAWVFAALGPAVLGAGLLLLLLAARATPGARPGNDSPRPSRPPQQSPGRTPWDAPG